jgi:hypothetical protein
MVNRITPREVHAWLEESLSTRTDLGFGKAIANLTLEPPSPFDRQARRKPKAGFLVVVLLMAVTAGLLLMIFAYIKLRWDHHRRMWITAEMMPDVYNHDLYSRELASKAIEKYNKHIEQCKRATEAAESGDDRPGWGETDVRSLRAELERVPEVTTQDRNKLQEELTQNSVVVADLSMRLEALSKKVNGNCGPAITSGTEPSPERPLDDTDSPATSTVCRKRCMPSGRRTDG